LAGDRIVVVSNPIAGRGGAAGIARSVSAAIERSGREAISVSASDRAGMGAAIRGSLPARALVVCGGDGTLHAVAGVGAETGVPVYQVPMGTENLFAREFGMTRDVGRVIDALDTGRVDRVDLARCNGEWFVLMCSVGPDASVIHRVDAARTGAITHLTYLPHIARELVRPHVATVRVEVDGEEVVPMQDGMVIVANSRQYGMRFDPAYGADMRDGLLDVVFLPARRRVRMVTWMALARLRSLHLGGGAVRVRGKRVVIESAGAPRFQVDGEAGRNREGAWRVEIEVVPGALGVVVPEEKRKA